MKSHFLTVFLFFFLPFLALCQTNFEWKKDLDLPFTDQNGNRLTGTEVIHLVTHKGKLFAGNSYWNETTEARRGQVWVKNTANGNWQRDFQMPTRNSRVPALFSAIFKTNAQGQAVAADTILIAGSTYDKGSNQSGPANIFMRNDATNTWVEKQLGTTSHAFEYTQIRSTGFYRDKITGVDIVFAGANPAPLGVFTGKYDPSVAGKIRWDATPEFTPSGFQRIMGFALCNDTFYMATQREIYKRIDGTNPRWVQVLNLATPSVITQYGAGLDRYWLEDDDIRGFRTVKNPSGNGEVLIFGGLNHIFRFHPRENYALVAEKNLKDLLNTETGHEFHYIQTQINVDFTPSNSSQTVQFIGFEGFYDTTYLRTNPQPNIAGFNQQGYYFERVQTGNQIQYFLREILDFDINRQPDSLARVRAFHVSPFPQDSGKVVYAGGFAPWFADVTNTAWIYKGNFKPVTAVGRTVTNNIPYQNLPNVDPNLQSLDVYAPNGGAAKKPVVVYVHGGSWMTGDKAHTALKDEFFNSLGYIFVSLNYRLSPNPPNLNDANRIKFPIHPQDVAKGLAWVVNNIGRYGGDTSRIVLLGHSAGAHLVSLVSTDQRFLAAENVDLGKIKCTCSLDAGAYDIPYYLNNWATNNQSQRNTYFNAFGSDPSVWAQASPITHIAATKPIPDFMLVHQGTRERIDLATRFRNALVPNNVAVTLLNAAPLDHEGINQVLGNTSIPQVQVYNDSVARFYARCLATATTTSIKNVMNESDVQLFPNPANDKIYLSFSTEAPPQYLTVFDTNGRIVLTQNKDFKELTINDLTAGLYFLKIQTERGFLVKKFIKN